MWPSTRSIRMAFHFRYFRKHSPANRAIAHGISHVVGSVEVGKLADLVMYSPAYFGVKPEMILKGGVVVCAQMGDANASYVFVLFLKARQVCMTKASMGPHPI